MKKVGGTIEDAELIDNGVVLNQNVVTSAGGPTRIEKAKIGLIQFQLSAPKPDVSPSLPLSTPLAALQIVPNLLTSLWFVTRLLLSVSRCFFSWMGGDSGPPLLLDIAYRTLLLPRGRMNLPAVFSRE